MWRPAIPGDDDAIIAMSLALFAEDPSPETVGREQVARTLDTLRREPQRGTAAVLELDEAVVGYALLIAFWSNELGGEVAIIDELYVAPSARGSGHALALLEQLAHHAGPYPRRAVALALETTPGNQRARRLYERAGFVAKNLGMRLRLPSAR
jgi:GNAT superfamily N-acetyltransferase